MLRVAVRDPRREAVERFTAEFAPLITNGPPGLAEAYASGFAARAGLVFAYWPTLVPRMIMKPTVGCRPQQLDQGNRHIKNARQNGSVARRATGELLALADSRAN